MNISIVKLKKIRSLVSDDGLVGVARLQFINLQMIKHAVGKSWPAMRDDIFTAGESFLGKRISSNDIIIQSSDGFLVILANTTEKDGCLQVKELGEGILEFFLGKKHLKNIKINSNYNRLSDQKISNSVIEMSSEEKEGTKTNKTTPLVFALPPAHKSTQLNLDPIHDITFAYHPIWDSLSNRITSYTLHPHNIIDEISREERDALPNDISSDDIRKLDFQMLLKAQEDFSSLLKDGEIVVISVTVSFETLAHPKSRNSYISQLAKVPEKFRKCFMVCIDRIPAGTPEFKLVEYIRYFDKLCSRILIHNLDSSINLSSFHGCKVHLFGFDLKQFVGSDQKLNSKNITSISAFCLEAKKMNACVYITGVNHRHQILILKRAGVQFFAGNSVGKGMLAPKSPAPLTPQDIFQRLEAS
ncbi:MAG: hypothetical protein COA47_03540 [Robiginitomaculum sp.]|nr:MAG: hypothetical protein COA47_03540 [Robiginitomaculum sp.]